MNNEVRQAYPLSQELETQIFDLLDKAWEFLEKNKIEEALAKSQEAWNLLPEPKFNTSCSHIILCDLIPFLNVSGKYSESKSLLYDWIFDLKSSGFRIYETTPFILLGETHLHLSEIEEAKSAFHEAVKYGATKRDFNEKPDFYFEIAKKKLTDNDEIKTLFELEIAKDFEPKAIAIELSDEVLEQIESLSEEGNEFFDDEDFEKAITVWKQALALIPNPQNTYAETLWLETSIGDAYFMMQNHQEAFPHFLNAKSNIEENAYENPFIMLRVGQLYFEANDFENAKEYLLRAYMFEGEAIFEGSKEKYFEFLKENVNLSEV
jgi:tetratricopeptide (TPR) repeat protein